MNSPKEWMSESLDKKESGFLLFLDESQDFSDEEKALIVSRLESSEMKELVKIFFVLLVWGGLMVPVDILWTGVGTLVLAVDNPAYSWVPFVSFLVLNGVVKFSYLSMKTNLNLWQKTLAIFPHLGGTFLLANTLKNEPELRSALGKFGKSEMADVQKKLVSRVKKSIRGL